MLEEPVIRLQTLKMVFSILFEDLSKPGKEQKTELFFEKGGIIFQIGFRKLKP
jgi:hypothetical protein